MSFLATANPPVLGSELLIQNDPWFPAVDPEALRKACRLDGTVTPDRLKHALLYALDSVNQELAAYQAARLAEGCAALADVPCPTLDGQSAQIVRYRRAVYACVQAELSEAYRDIDTTPHSEGKSDRIKERIEAKADGYLRAMRWAISDLLGQRRTTVELI